MSLSQHIFDKSLVTNQNSLETIVSSINDTRKLDIPLHKNYVELFSLTVYKDRFKVD